MEKNLYVQYALNSLHLLMIYERNLIKKIPTTEKSLMVEEMTLGIVDMEK